MDRRDLDGFSAGFADELVVEDARGDVLVRGLEELRAVVYCGAIGA